MYLGVHELTVVEKIWAITTEVVVVVAEITGAESEEHTLTLPRKPSIRIKSTTIERKFTIIYYLRKF